MRYKKLIYAVPQHINQFDVTDEVEQQNPVIITGKSAHEVKKLIDKHVMTHPHPHLIEENYKSFNIIGYRNEYYAMDVGIGDIDLSTVDISKYIKDSRCFIGDSIAEIKHFIDIYRKELTSEKRTYPHPHLIEENYKGFNIIGYRDKYYAMDVGIGDMDISETDLSKHMKDGRCFIGDSIEGVKYFVDLYNNTNNQ